MTLAENELITPVFDSIYDIYQNILGSGINIAPDALVALSSLNLTQLDLENFIRRVSFSQIFNSHVTLDCIKKEFPQYNDNNSSSTPIPSLNNSSPVNSNKISSSGEMKQKGYGKPENACDIEIRPTPNDSMDISNLLLDNNSLTQNSSQNNSQNTQSNTTSNHLNEKFNPNISTKNITPQVPANQELIKIVDEPNTTKSTNPSFSNTIKTSSPSQSVSILTQTPAPIILPKLKKHKKSDDDDENFNIDEESGDDEEEEDEILNQEDEDEIARIREEKRKQWEKLQLRSSSNTFRPKAADYSFQINTIKDPTGKLFTEGKLEDFHAVQKDKFQKLKAILERRPEGTGLLEIERLNSLQNSTEVKFIGMVVEKRQNASKNFTITFEDPTGIISVLVRNDPQRNGPLIDLMLRLLPDHVCIVEGYLSINAERKSRIVMANNIIFPDAPHTHTINYRDEDVAVCLISDTHFGSKDWMGKVWDRFVDYLNCRLGSDSQVEQAGKIKYISIAGDLVDGIGVYPNQEKRLDILDIYEQYNSVAEHFSNIPDYIKIIVSPGDHDAVRKAIPCPALPKEFAQQIQDVGGMMVGCPALVELHGIKTQIFHGTSLIDMNMSIPGLKNEDPVGTMRELIRARHIAPTYGKKTELAPTELDWLVMDPLPDILHTGHLHKNGCGWSNGVLAVNSGCFQAQTDYMKSFGIDPDIGKPTIVNLKGPALKPVIIDLYDI
jgi:DNA polymerase II small subunit